MNNTKKIVLIGHFGVGKSSLIRRFVQNSFSDDYMVTIGVHILKKSLAIKNQEITFVIWDIEGKEDVQKVRSSYLLGTSAFVYVIDPTRKTTFENWNIEMDFINQNYPNTPILTVANKSDLIEIESFKTEIKNLDLKIDFFASAKSGNNVEEIFLNLGQLFFEL